MDSEQLVISKMKYITNDTTEEDKKFFVDEQKALLKCPDGKAEGKLCIYCYKNALLEIMVGLKNNQERAKFIEKHLLCYSNEKSIWLYELKEILISPAGKYEVVSKLETYQKKEFLELIDTQIKEIEEVKQMSYEHKKLYILNKLASLPRGSYNICAILGLQDKEDCYEIARYLKKILLIEMSGEYVNITSEGREYLDYFKSMNKMEMYIIENLSRLNKELIHLTDEGMNFLSWCDDVARYLEKANEPIAIETIEFYKKAHKGISIIGMKYGQAKFNIEVFKIEMEKILVKIIKDIRAMGIRQPQIINIKHDNSTNIMKQDNSTNNSLKIGGNLTNNGVSNITFGNNNQNSQENLQNSLQESEIKNLISQFLNDLKTDLPSLQLDNEEIEELKKEIEETETIIEQPLSKKAGWKLGAIRNILLQATGSALGNLVTIHLDKLPSLIEQINLFLKPLS